MLQETSNFFVVRQNASAEVIFPVLPFAQIAPALEASTISTILNRDAITTKVLYYNRQFTSLAGHRLYETAAAGASLNGLLSDWVFREAAFGPMNDRKYLSSMVERGYIEASFIPTALRARDLATAFLLQCEKSIAWNSVKVVCFSDTFAKRDAVSGQLMASLALSRMVKSKHPHVVIVLSGHYTEGVMGEALKDLDFLDFVCTKNAYQEIPRFIRSVLNKKQYSNIATNETSTPSNFSNSELKLPIPNFDDYFSLQGDGLPGRFDTIPIETSKGCWWADRNHCTFCALPGDRIRFISKTPIDVLNEISVQIERYSPSHIEMNDLIIDNSYFASVFPKLATINKYAEIFLETKTHLKRPQISLLRRCGVTRLQGGLETLSKSSLKKMTKGVNVAMNIDFLQSCRSEGIYCYWNYLHSFPGETALDVTEAFDVIRQASNIDPPATIQAVRVERFSPFHSTPKEYGISHVRPDRSYRQLYENTAVNWVDLAFYHEHTEAGQHVIDRNGAIKKLEGLIYRWREKEMTNRNDTVQRDHTHD